MGDDKKLYVGMPNFNNNNNNNNVNINYVNDKFMININIGHFGIRSGIELHNTCCYGTYC